MTPHNGEATAAPRQTFFNLPQRKDTTEEKSHFGPTIMQTMQTHWRTLKDQPLTSDTIIDLLANRIPVIRQESFFTPEELSKMLAIVRTHEIVWFPLLLFPWFCLFPGLLRHFSDS